MDPDPALRQHLLDLLSGGGAHVGVDAAVADLPFEMQGLQPADAPHTPWQLLEHLRVAQWDILEFSRNPDHVSPPWPEGYWPESESPPDDGAWERSTVAFRADLEAMKALVADPANDLHAPFPWSDDASLLGEALLVADHNAYHLGQLVLLRRQLDAWP